MIVIFTSIVEISCHELILLFLFLLQIKLHSLYRYQPRLHIVQLPSPLQASTSRGCIFSSHVFTETQFVAVTAYQNDQVRTYVYKIINEGITWLISH